MIQHPGIHEGIFENPNQLELTKHQRERVLGPLVAFLEEHPTRVGDVLLGRATGKWNRKDIRQIEGLILDKCEETKKSADFLRVLRKAAAIWAVRQRQNVHLPSIPVALPYPANPLKGNLVRELARYRAWKNECATWIDPGNRDAADPELIVVSAILFGGILNTASIVALLRALARQPQVTTIADGRLHVDLSLTFNGVKDLELRRWQPDPLTAMLWMRTPSKALVEIVSPEQDLTDQMIMKRFAARLRSRAPAGKQKLRLGGLNALLRAARTVSHIELPGALAHYSRRSFVSHSVSSVGFERLISDAKVRAKPPEVIPESKDELAHQSDFHEEEDRSAFKEDGWTRLRAAFQGQDRTQVRDSLNAIARDETAGEFIRRLADFGDSLLGSLQRSGRRGNIGATLRCVRLLFQRMGCFVDGEDPAKFDLVLLEAIYLQMIEGAGQQAQTRKLRRNLGRAIAEFHRYLMARFQIDPVENELLQVSLSGFAQVDANLVTIEAYDRILQKIEDESSGGERAVLRMMVILGFRCGLRRREALYLQIGDLLPLSGELLIRPNSLRKLKTTNARRRLPLMVLLEATEWAEMLAWYRSRISQGATESDPLFAIPQRGWKTVPESIFQNVNQLMVRATGDPGIHFHHLRHSFATWTITRLLIAGTDIKPSLFPHLPRTSTFLNESQKFFLGIYRGGVRMRSHLYLLAQLLGHGSPGTSLEHYVHSLDWLLPFYLSQSELMVAPKHAVLAATGLPRSTLQRWEEVNRDFLYGLWFRKAKREGFEAEAIDYPPGGAEPAPGVRELSTTNWIDLMWNFLWDVETGQRSRDEAISRYMLDPGHAEESLVRARFLKSLVGERGAIRHRMERWIPDRQSPQEKLLACPSRPVTEDAKSIINQYSGPLFRLADSDADLVQQALKVYVFHVDPRLNAVFFPDHGAHLQANNYLQFLLQLGLKQGRILIQSGDSKERSKPLAEWKRLLGLNQHHWIEKAKKARANGHKSESSLSMEPRFEVDTEQPSNKTGAGFRFLMTMGYIAFGPV